MLTEAPGASGELTPQLSLAVPKASALEEHGVGHEAVGIPACPAGAQQGHAQGFMLLVFLNLSPADSVRKTTF